MNRPGYSPVASDLHECSLYDVKRSAHLLVKLFGERADAAPMQVEVLRQLHPQVCFYLFDIPPQLYVSERYLSCVFPDAVVSYQTTRTMNESAGAVFLQQKMDGKRIAKEQGSFGVLRQTTLEDYKSSLPDFELIDISISLRPVGIYPGHHDTFWKRKSVMS